MLKTRKDMEKKMKGKETDKTWPLTDSLKAITKGNSVAFSPRK